MAMTCVARTLAPADLGCAQQAGEKTVTVKDGWGNQASVKGFQEEHQAGSKWFIHDPERPQPRAVEPGPSSTLGAKPPEDAVVLFDGTDASGWTGGPWRVANGYMEVNGTGNITSKAEFGDGRLHVEFATPPEPKGIGQDRGNSGVFLMGRYEVQVLDNWKAATYADGMAGRSRSRTTDTPCGSGTSGSRRASSEGCYRKTKSGARCAAPVVASCGVLAHGQLKARGNRNGIFAPVHTRGDTDSDGIVAGFLADPLRYNGGSNVRWRVVSVNPVRTWGAANHGTNV
jgi:hypothetical protein